MDEFTSAKSWLKKSMTDFFNILPKERLRMPEDIFSDLKAKEEELEVLLEGARTKALAIREEALRKARELKEAKAVELESELAAISEEREAAIREEAERIEREGEAAAAKLKATGEKNMDRAVEEVIRFITGAGGAEQ